jgi:alanyl-tRNA synthetase
MNSKDVRNRYLKFFEQKEHAIIDPAPLVLPNDPTTLFTSSGMQPLVPFLMGKEHPEGTRLVDVQPVIRTGDIEEVGDNRHLTFFEMIGNWSLGDYFKAEQLAWIFDFYTNKDTGLGLDPNRLYVTVFEGDGQIEKDFTSIDIWKNIFESVGITAEEAVSPDSIWFHNNGRIFAYSAKKNWWSRSGTPDEMPVGEIGGPDSEMFYDFGEELGLHENSPWKDEPCHPNCDCGRFIEIGNSVFIQYKKKEDGTLVELPQKNVDFGGGFERIVAATNNDPDSYKSDLFWPMIESISKVAAGSYEEKTKEYRIIVDHIKASVALIANGVVSSNKQQGYVLRRLLRRAIVNLKNLKVKDDNDFYALLVDHVFDTYDGVYFQGVKKEDVLQVITDEVHKFERTLDKGLKLLEKLQNPTSKDVFDLYQSYGFPLELTQELLVQRGQKVDIDEIKREMEKHQETSRTTSAGTFKGGLADSSETVTKLHTATHLLQAALRAVLGDHVIQKGQNITGERSRFDFAHPEKLTQEQITLVEGLINEKIKEDLHVNMEILPKEEAEKTTAIHAFNERYGDKVQIYYIGDTIQSAFSSEYCGGPHVSHTGEIGHVTIKKQEKVGNGIMRVYLILDE